MRGGEAFCKDAADEGLADAGVGAGDEDTAIPGILHFTSLSIIKASGGGNLATRLSIFPKRENGRIIISFNCASPWPKPPRPQSRAAGSLAHPFQQGAAAMPASWRALWPPATPPILVENTLKEIYKDHFEIIS